jgi:hypothetical protein
MKHVGRIVGATAAVAVLSCVLACGATQKVREARMRMERSNDFKRLGLAFHGYHDKHGSGPPDQQAFLKWAQQESPEAVPIIQQTEPGASVTFQYGKWRLGKDFELGPGNTVMATDNAPQPDGKKVTLFANGSVRMMTDGELAAAARPKKGKD